MDLHDPGIELGSPALQVDSLPTELSGKPEPRRLELSWHRDPMWDIHKEQRNTGPLRIVESGELGTCFSLRIWFILGSVSSLRSRNKIL